MLLSWAGTLVGFFTILSPSTSASDGAVYHAQSDHPANVVHRALFERQDGDQRVGIDALDPYLWPGTKTHLLTGESHQQAIESLDALLALEDLDLSVRARVLLQRDLWAVLAWLLGRELDVSGEALAGRLARAMRRVAVEKESLELLEGNYASAVTSRRWQKAPTKDARPFLPPDLLAKEAGDWVTLGKPGPGSIAAPVHVAGFGGRSAFFVKIRVPGGRDATLRYLEKLGARTLTVARDGTYFFRGDLPHFPVGTTVALVRRALAITVDGQRHVTPFVTQIQFRHYLSLEAPPTDGMRTDLTPFQQVFEFELSRAAWRRGESGGLHALDRESRGFPSIFGHGVDPFESEGHGEEGVVLETCGSCHAQPGVYSVATVMGGMSGPGAIMAFSIGEERLAPEPTVDAVEIDRLLKHASELDSWKRVARWLEKVGQQ